MPENRYQQRAAHFRAAADSTRQRIAGLANARLLLFAGTAVGLILLRDHRFFFWAAVIAAIALFILLVVRHRAAREDLRILNAHLELCAFGLARRQRDWPNLPYILDERGLYDHAYAQDLNLFGRAALTQLCGPVYTLHGKRTLRRWLLHGATPDAIAERQQAVRALAPDIGFREDLAVTAQHASRRGQERLDHFIRWVAEAELPAPHAAIVWLARLVPLATVTLIIAQVAGLLAESWWLIPLTVSSSVCVLRLKRIYRTFDDAFSRDPAPLAFASVFEIAQRVPGNEAVLEQLRRQLNAGGTPASTRIAQLQKIMLYADVRYSGTLSLVLEAFFLWSFHLWVALREWREAAKADLPAWFDSLGTLEALSSIATLAHDQPDWCFPDIDRAANRIAAARLGHPMLRDDVRVHNDVAVGPPGSFLLVTGSNMSGKSTLLRAIGVNTVLAQAGAPVCAQRYAAPPLRLFTYIGVRDSLAGGVSLYMAQLKRIKTIVDAAEADTDRLCCYLLDEILSGTNSTDRTTAVRAVVHRLLARPAIGALATHDLALAGDETIRAAAHSIHFRETIDPGSGEMSFDYLIRPGPVETSNALELMRLMGL